MKQPTARADLVKLGIARRTFGKGGAQALEATELTVCHWLDILSSMIEMIVTRRFDAPLKRALNPII